MTPEVSRQPASHGREFRIARQRFEADQGQPLQGIQAAAARRLHARTGDAFELDLRQTLPDLAHEPGRELVAGHLAGHDPDPDRSLQRCHVKEPLNKMIYRQDAKVARKIGDWIQTENTWRSWRLGDSRGLNQNFLNG